MQAGIRFFRGALPLPAGQLDDAPGDRREEDRHVAQGRISIPAQSAS